MVEFSLSAIESSRFQAWAYCAFFSMFRLLFPFFYGSYFYLWTITTLSISAGLSLVASMAYIIAKKQFESSVAEGGLAVLLLIVWVCALPILSFNHHVMYGEADLLVSAWVSFMCVLFVVQDFTMEKAKRARRLVNEDNASKVAKWFGLAVVAVVLVANASVDRALFSCGEMPGDPQCVRLALGIALGAITIPLSVFLGLSSMGSVLTTKAEASAALTLHIVGVIFLTLGNNALTLGNNAYTLRKNPRSSYVDNTFFSTWISFFLSALLTQQCLADLYKQHTESTDVSSTQVVHDQVPVEAFAVADDIENVERAIDDDDGHSA